MFGVTAPVEVQKIVVDKKVQWRYAGNVRHNALIRTVLYTPVRWVKAAGNKKQ